MSTTINLFDDENLTTTTWMMNVMIATKRIATEIVAMTTITTTNKMHETPKHIYEDILQERPFCERQELLHDHECRGRSTMEHAHLYRGRQICEKWAIIRLCAWSHLGPGLDKRKNEFISLRHATLDDLKKYPKKNWLQIIQYLNKKYGNKS